MSFTDRQFSIREPQASLRLLVPHPEVRLGLVGPARTGRSLALLAYLHLGPPETTRDELCELLWNPEPGQDSQHRLRELLSSTRRFLPPGILITAGRNVSVERDALESDVILFRRAAAAGRLSEAAVLYEADFFSGGIPSGASLFSDWADGVARSLREELAVVLRQAIGLYETSGQLSDAAAAARRLWRMCQDDEENAVLFITMCSRAGDGAAALSAAAAVEEHWTAMGLHPGGRLAEEIRAARTPRVAIVASSQLLQDRPRTDEAGGSVDNSVQHVLEPPPTPAPLPSGRRRARLLALAFAVLVTAVLGLSVFTSSEVLDPTTLLVPADGSPEVSTAPSFVWSSVEGANRYWLLVATTAEALPTDRDANSCSGCVVSGSTTSTSHSLPNAFPITPGGGRHPTLEAGTTYYWKVLAWNTAGPHPSGQYSETWVFRTAAPSGGR